ncbi:hypothetical protein GH714_007229 [Hevea brasiliensis]|uniref:Uncharacterized protein n=1 Tax=Hevea brasiliensis TaxID=3981 RepID=A0A6A6KJV6_HEVBR|nr:hypothetical protein GH714_007229 [Hevea brasiliensis]
MLSSAYARSSSSDGLDVDPEVVIGSLGMVESSEEERRVLAARISNKRKAKRAPLLSNPPFQQEIKQLNTQIRYQEEAVIAKLVDTYLDLQTEVMADPYERHLDKDFSWVKDLLPKGADFLAMGDDREERFDPDVEDAKDAR